MTEMELACEHCLRHAWLLSRIAPHLEHHRARIEVVLTLTDDRLAYRIGGPDEAQLMREWSDLDVARLLEEAEDAGLETICACDPRYPQRLWQLHSPPHALFVAGGLGRFLELAAGDAVAVVGSRRASPYGLEVARSLGRALAVSGVPVVSGMALGIDSAAHSGALDAARDTDSPPSGEESAARTIAVLPGSASDPYPASKRALHRRIVAGGVAISELPPGTNVWRWMFPARNRIIAALGTMTVVVEAGVRSGSLVTARIARELGRPLGAVPGRITNRQAQGTNDLLASGASIVRGPQDVLDVLYGAGVRLAPAEPRVEVGPEATALLGALGQGYDTAAAFQHASLDAQDGLAALAELELAGYVRRALGGQYLVTAGGGPGTTL